MFLTPKLSYRSYRFFSSLRRWTRRRFTQTGLALLGGAGISGVMSADTEQTLGYQIFPLVGCLLLTSLAWGWGFRGRFGVRRLLPRFATAGQALRYRVVVGNQGRRPQKGLTVLEDLADSRPSCAEFIADRRAERARMSSFSMAWLWNRRRSWMATVKAVPVPDLPPGQEAEVELELVPSRRGILRFEGVTVARTDPLGLVRAFTRWPAAQSLLVLPRRYPLPPIALPGGRRYQQGGVAMASSVGDSEEFVSLREYRRGDPLRHIHWRSWAKVDKPIVKEFQDEFFVRHALILDTYLDHPTSPSFEGAISVAASFACSIQTQESLLDLLFVGARAYAFTVGRGLAHTDQMLEVLAAVQPCGEQSFDALEQLVLGHAGLVSGCICVLLCWDERRQALVRRLRTLGIPVLVVVVLESGDGASLQPGPLQDQPRSFHVLQASRLKEGLAEL